MRECDDGCVVETVGGKEDKEDRYSGEKKRKLLFHTVNSLKFKAKDNGF